MNPIASIATAGMEKIQAVAATGNMAAATPEPLTLN
jgi:hypothetical protein